jgi:hypothetical protein
MLDLYLYKLAVGDRYPAINSFRSPYHVILTFLFPFFRKIVRLCIYFTIAQLVINFFFGENTISDNSLSTIFFGPPIPQRKRFCVNWFLTN